MTLQLSDRDVYIQARSLVLKALDLLDRHFLVGKYKGFTVENVDDTASTTVASYVVTNDKT